MADKLISVTVCKTATFDVSVEEARAELVANFGYDFDKVADMDDREVAEIWMSHAEGDTVDLCFDREIYSCEV